MSKRALCGIDEAGRGCIAGSLVIAGVVLTAKVEGLMDSKKLTEKKKRVYIQLLQRTQNTILSLFPLHR